MHIGQVIEFAKETKAFGNLYKASGYLPPTRIPDRNSGIRDLWHWFSESEGNGLSWDVPLTGSGGGSGEFLNEDSESQGGWEGRRGHRPAGISKKFEKSQCFICFSDDMM